MKLKFLTFILLVFITTFSCSRDESSSSTDIVGKWTLVSFEVSNFEGTGNTIDDSKNKMPRPIFEFKNDGKFLYNLQNTNVFEEMSYTVNGNQITFGKSLAYGHTPIFSYTIANNTMTLTSSDSHGSYTENTKIVLKK